MPPVLRSKSTLSLLSYQTFPPHLPTPSTTVSSPPTKESAITSYLMDPQPPQAPNPWVWRCHLCHITYRLGCTRRCLECSHEFCTTLETASPKPGSIKKKRTRRRGGGPCKAEFDYAEWQKYGAWRRTIVLNDGSSQQQQSGRAVQDGNWGREVDATTEKEREQWTKKKERLFILGKHDCWQHCDYPSECRHTLYAAIVEGRAVQASPTVDVMEDQSGQYYKEEHALTSDIYIESDIMETDETAQDVDDGTLAIIAPTTEQLEMDCCTDLDLSTLQAMEEDEDLDPSMVKMLRGRQERRSQRKLARLTGLDSLSPLDDVDTVSSVPEATTRLLNISSDHQQLLASRLPVGTTPADQDENDGAPLSSVGLRLPQVDEDGHISTHVGFERMSSCCPGQGYTANADDWESWSDSSGSSGSSSSSALTYTDSMAEDDSVSVGKMSSDDDEACPVSHYGLAPDDDDDASPIDNHDDLSAERDLIALIRMRNAFMRGDI